MRSVETIADCFFHAFYNKDWPGDSAPDFSSLSIAESYEVQDLVARKRIELGESIAGFKVGCTSAAIRAQLGFNEPINARIFRPYIFDGPATLDWRDYLNCAIEPEMVLKISKNLKGKNLSDDELIAAITYVSPGIEIHNFKFWHTSPTIQELICSGGIHAGLIIGNEKVKPVDLQFQNELFYVYKDGNLITSASASKIMGGPLNSLRWLVKKLTQKGFFLRKDSLVIPGSPVELMTIDQDTELTVVVENVGSLTSFFKSNS